jgi:hypothetical protein
MDKINWRSIGNWAIVIAVFSVGYAVYPQAECEFGLGPVAQSEQPVACAEQHPLGERTFGWFVGVSGVLVMLASRVVLGRARRRLRAEMRAENGGRERGQESTWSRAGGGAGGRDDIPESITISQEFEVDLPGEGVPEEDADALINYLEEEEELQQQADRADRRDTGGSGAGRSDIGGFYCPPGLEDAPVLYVDSQNGAASDEMDELDARVNQPERPFATIQAALDRAHRLFMSSRTPVQVRVSPGVYQEKLVVAGQVSLVNHRLPAEGSVRQHLEWLVAQEEVGDSDRVTLLAPADADFAVKFEHAQNQGIFGCHLIGREGVGQQGIVAADCMSLTIAHCSVEDFAGGGVRLNSCGGSLTKTAAQIVGCRLRNNHAVRGGAVFVRGGTLCIEKTRFEKNRSSYGGAVFAIDLSGPLLLRETGFRGNEAESEDSLGVRPDVVALEDWLQGSGQGGAVAVVRSQSKLSGCKFIDNKAKISGGALALLGAQAVFESRGSGNTFRQNLARVGGAVFMAGWMGCRATLKASGTKFVGNRAASDGGGLAVIGLAVAQIVGARFQENESRADAGIGGAVASLKGGQFMAKETRFRANISAGRGGAAGAINASLVLSNGCIVEENTAQGGEGGGVCCLSRSNASMEALTNRTDFKLPLVFTTRDVAIRNNRSAGQTAGLLVGNDESVATFPIKVTIEKPMFVRNNKASGGSEKTADLVVRWRGEVLANSSDRVKKELLLN